MLRYDTNFPKHAFTLYIYIYDINLSIYDILFNCDSISPGNKIICGDIVFNISI